MTGSPRVWDIPTIPHDVNQIVDCNGVVWSRAEFGFWETFNTNGGLEGCFDEIGLLGTYGPLTEQETEHDS